MSSNRVDDWRSRGTFAEGTSGEVFWLDVPADESADLDPVLVVHGYPTCSYDWHRVLPALAARRRVVMLDLPGFGLSAKPDSRYSVRGYADAVETVASAAGLDRVALVTHDMGDTVGGELLARDLEGNLSFSVASRILTNGSIYIDMAQLTPGQQFLLALPDERIEAGPDGAGFVTALAAICGPTTPPDPVDLDALWSFTVEGRGHTLLARTIRYIEDRRAEEDRFTGAIERHRSPLGVVWGALDPVAVVAMTDRLLRARPDTRLVLLDDVGHFPMLEAPDRLGAAILDLLDGFDRSQRRG